MRWEVLDMGDWVRSVADKLDTEPGWMCAYGVDCIVGDKMRLGSKRACKPWKDVLGALEAEESYVWWWARGE